MRCFLVAVLAVCMALPSLAEDDNGATELTKLMTAYDVRGWEAVGRLNIGWSGMCTGALIAPDLVLTAGHCLYSTRTGARVDPTKIEFLAGWRQGRASATRRVKRAVIHPDYAYTGPQTNETMRYDLAILELNSPIRLPHIQPFPVGNRPRKGASVGVVSYARSRADSPSIQKVCHVLARPAGTLVMSCDVDFGSSGAPVFAEIDGKPQIVSVISSMSSIRGRPVAFGTRLKKPLTRMKEMLARGEVVTVGEDTPVATESNSTNKPRILRSGGGAKFVKP